MQVQYNTCLPSRKDRLLLSLKLFDAAPELYTMPQGSLLAYDLTPGDSSTSVLFNRPSCFTISSLVSLTNVLRLRIPRRSTLIELLTVQSSQTSTAKYVDATYSELKSEF